MYNTILSALCGAALVVGIMPTHNEQDELYNKIMTDCNKPFPGIEYTSGDIHLFCYKGEANEVPPNYRKKRKTS